MNKNISKIIVLLLLVFNIVGVEAQINCKIKVDDWVSFPVCYGEEINMSVDADPNCTYQWSKNGIDISGETNFYLTAEITEDDVKYGVKVFNVQTQEECKDEITIDMLETFEIEFEQTQLTCSNNNAENGQNAKAIATAYGDNFVSFTYEWGSNIENDVWTNPSNPQEAIGLKAWKEYYVDVFWNNLRR